jgi:hypothetical protein
MLLLASAKISLLQKTLLIALILLMHLQFALFVLLVPLLNQLLQMLVSFLLADDLVGVEHGQL